MCESGMLVQAYDASIWGVEVFKVTLESETSLGYIDPVTQNNTATHAKPLLEQTKAKSKTRQTAGR